MKVSLNESKKYEKKAKLNKHFDLPLKFKNLKRIRKNTLILFQLKAILRFLSYLLIFKVKNKI